MKVLLKFRLFTAVLLSLWLMACAEEPEEYKILPLSTLYNNGLDALLIGKKKDAIKFFSEVQRQYPYTEWSGKALLLTGYSHFISQDYPEAIFELDNFVNLYPASEHVPYAMYLKGLAYYDRLEIADRDQSITKLAEKAFLELIVSFPDSTYAQDARYKIVLVRNQLAANIMFVARYYMQYKFYNAALARFNEILENYSNSAYTPEAIYRMAASYLALGLDEDSINSLKILEANYNDSEWYQETYDLLLDYKLISKK